MAGPSAGDSDLVSALSKDAGELSPGELRHLEAEFEEQVARMEEMRLALGHHREFQREQHDRRLKGQLETLERRATQERQQREELEARLHALREKEAAVALQGDAVEESLDGVSTQHELENIAILRIKADHLRSQREALQRLEENRRAEIEAILEEADRRNESSEFALRRLLQRVDHLRRELDQPEYDKRFYQGVASEIVEELEGEGEAEAATKGKDGFVKLLDKVTAVREERWRAKVKKLEDELGGLCDERMRLLGEEETVKARRTQHEALLSKGLDYLVEVELGNAPPVDVVLANLSPTHDNAPSNQETHDVEEHDLEALICVVENGIQASENTIMRLKSGIIEAQTERKQSDGSMLLTAAELQPYDSSLGRQSYPAHQQHTYDLVRGVLEDCVNEILASPVFDRAWILQNAERAVTHWKAASQALLERLDEELFGKCVRQVADEILTSVLELLVHGVYKEFQTAEVLAAHVADNLIVGGVLSIYSVEELSQSTEDQVRSTLAEMQKRRDQQHTQALTESRIVPTTSELNLERPLLPQDISDYSSTNAAFSAEAIQRIKAELDRRMAIEREYEARLEEERHHLDTEPQGHRENAPESGREDDQSTTSDGSEAAEEEDITVLHFDSVAKVTGADVSDHDSAFLTKEQQFWNRIQFRSKHVKVSQRHYGTPSAVAFSAGGDYLAVGTGLGAVLVYHLRPVQHATLIRKFVDSGQRAMITQVVWSMDAGSRLLVVDDEGTVRLFSTQSTPGFTKSFGKHVTPDMLDLLLELTWKDFARPEQRDMFEGEDLVAQFTERAKRSRRGKVGHKNRELSGPEAELKPILATFHTGHTFLGLQTSFIVGLANGTLVKWNTASRTGERFVVGPTHAKSEPSNPFDASLVPGQPRPRGNLFGATICREFFQDHDAPPRFLGFVNRCSEMLYSLDESNQLRLWSYDPSHFSGFGWYVPSERFKLDLRSVAFNADRNAPVDVLFPPPGVSVPSEPKPGTVIHDDLAGPTDDEILELYLDFLLLQEQELVSVKELGLQDRPWLVKEMERGRYMEIYAPRDFPEDGPAQHQVLIFSTRGILLKRLRSTFIPVPFAGQLEDVCMSSSGTEIFFLAQFQNASLGAPSLRVYTYDTHTLELEPTFVEIELTGQVQPRVSVSPVLRGIGTDVAYILDNNTVHCVSLTSGELVCNPLAPVKNEGQTHLVDVKVSRDHEHLCCLAANSDTLYLYAIENQAEEADLVASTSGAYRPRQDRTPRECDV